MLSLLNGYYPAGGTTVSGLLHIPLCSCRLIAEEPLCAGVGLGWHRTVQRAFCLECYMVWTHLQHAYPWPEKA